jgi:hypothetical protein
MATKKKRSTIKSRKEEIRAVSKRRQRFEFQSDVSADIGKALSGFKEGIESGGGGAGILKRIGKVLKRGKGAKRGLRKSKAEQADIARERVAAKRRAAKKRKDTGVSFATKETLTDLKRAQKALKTATGAEKKKALQTIQRNLGSKVAAQLGRKSVGKVGGKGVAGGKQAGKTPGQERVGRAFKRGAIRKSEAQRKAKFGGFKNAAEQQKSKDNIKALRARSKASVKANVADRKALGKRLEAQTKAEQLRIQGLAKAKARAKAIKADQKAGQAGIAAAKKRRIQNERIKALRARSKASVKKNVAEREALKKSLQITPAQRRRLEGDPGPTPSTFGLTGRKIKLGPLARAKANQAKNLKKANLILQSKGAAPGQKRAIGEPFKRVVPDPKTGLLPRLPPSDATLQRKLDVLRKAGRKGPVSKRTGLPLKLDGKKLVGKIKVPIKKKNMSPAAIKKRILAGERVSERENKIFDKAFPNKAQIKARKAKAAFKKKTPEQKRKILNKQARDRRADGQGSPGTGSGGTFE